MPMVYFPVPINIIIYHHTIMNLQKILRSLATSLLFLVPIFPLIVANPLFFPFITGKAFYFRIVVELAFAAWIILAFLDAKYRPKFTPLTIGVTLFALITLVADLLGVNPMRSLVSNFERMEGWLVIVHLWMFYMTATHMLGRGEEGRRSWHRWFNASLVISLFVAGYALAQLFGWAAVHQGSIRLDASLGNAAYLAVYMLMHVGIAAYLFFVARAKQIANAAFLQWAYSVIAILFGFIIIETQTRGTIVGLVGGIMLALALYAICAKKESTRSRSIAAGVIGLIIVLGVVFWMNRTSAFVKNHPALDRIGSISLSDTKTQARAYVWPMALKGFTQRPILGWGQENFNYIFNANYNPKMWGQEQWFDRAHSVFLDWLVASGAVGLIVYLALYVLALMAIWKSTLTVAEKSVLTGLIAGYAVHNVFVFDNLASYALFFAVLGFSSSVGVTKKSTQPKMALWLEKKSFSSDAVEYIVAPVVLVALVAGVYFMNIRPIQANTGLIAAMTSCSDRTGKADPAFFEKALGVNSYMANQEIREQLLSCTAGIVGSGYPGPTKQAFYDLAFKEIQAQVAATPNDARIFVLGGSFLNNLNQLAEAEKLLIRAHELTPAKQTVSFQLATDFVNEGKTDEALALLKTAYDADPTYDDARSAYITALIFAGKEKEARATFGNDPIFDSERAAQAYVSLKQYDKAIAIYNKILAADPKSIPPRVQLAEVQRLSGSIWSAIETIRVIAKDHPEYKDQVEEAVKQMQAKQ